MIIYQTLIFLRDQINAHFKKVLGDEHDETTVVSNVISNDGAVPAIALDKVLITLYNIEEEKVIKAQRPHLKLINGKEEVVYPDLRVNLSIIISANKTSYEEALKAISHVITFFQGMTLFDQANSPGLHEDIKKIVLEYYTFPSEQVNHLWGTFGTKHMPFVGYKVRMLTIQSDRIIKTPDSISGTSVMSE